MTEIFPDFGKYGTTIWICYGVSIAILLAFAFQILRNNSKFKK